MHNKLILIIMSRNSIKRRWSYMYGLKYKNILLSDNKVYEYQIIYTSNGLIA